MRVLINKRSFYSIALTFVLSVQNRVNYNRFSYEIARECHYLSLVLL